ncbi:hypothetical protein EKO04_003362 [Ascochyta lentis]|uniref:Transmembrane protein n=1 Tax=Ascochyta lentis TaxID=205686 RepID=A0A8H7J9I7_9PLEO|nr:hypothetical protein EKO04_003362 [Ascochyta lentis]
MGYHKRDLSKDITSKESHATPLPTYYSQQLPRWTSKSAFEDQKAFEVKAEPLGPCYPQFTASMPRFDDIPLPPRPQRRRLPRKAVLVPWILAAVFFLVALWFTSIALGVRLFMVLQPTSNPPVQEIHVLINADMLHDFTSTYTSFITLSATATKTAATESAPTLTNNGNAVPTTTGELVAAPIPNVDPLEIASDSMFATRAPMARNIQMSPTGFKTFTRMVQRAGPSARGASEAL